MANCPIGVVKGTVKVFAKWIPVGTLDSKYDKDCNKKDSGDGGIGV
jgi:hypothetical protein